MDQQQSGVKTWQWVVTIIVIIVLIVIGILVFGGTKSTTPVVDQNTPTDTTGTAALNRIVMTDQYPGNVVYLSSVQLDKPAWVVIQADNAGQPGAIIGSMHFDAGLSAGGKITLSKPTTDGATYYAVIYTDAGGATKFDATQDMPLKDANGAVIMKIFHASASAGASLKG